jgi:hypothetical protein
MTTAEPMILTCGECGWVGTTKDMEVWHDNGYHQSVFSGLRTCPVCCCANWFYRKLEDGEQPREGVYIHRDNGERYVVYTKINQNYEGW